MSARDYRHDIDGLRAIAVLAVLLFHLGVPEFPGGFVGVDVFFVISGFLITGLLVRERRTTGTIDFRAFYIRRFMRLHPALLATLAATWAAAVFLLGPGELKAFSHSMLAAAVSASNIYFWQTAGYFDVASSAKPLLHTWSLAVEEQFYLVWPLLILWATKRGHLGLTLALVATISLAGNILGIALGWESAVFYLMPFRMFELAMGAGLALAMPAMTLNERNKSMALLAGLSLIAWAIFWFHEGMAFPSFPALLPCAGAVLVLLSGDGRLGKALLGSEPMAWVGRLSYSLYLAHWPIVSLFFFSALRGPNDLERIWLLAATVAAAILLHYFVEQPFRWKRGALQRRKLAAWGAAAGTVLLVALAGAFDGLAFRIPAETRQLLAKTNAEAAAGKEGFLAEGCFTGGSSKTFASDFDFATCLAPMPGKENVLLIGDSSAAYAYGAMAEIANTNGIHLQQFTVSGCQPHIGPVDGACVDRNAWFFANLDQFKGQRVVLMASWRPQAPTVMGETLETLKSAGLRPYLVGPSLTFTRSLPGLVSSSVALASGLSRGSLAIEREALDIDLELASIAAQHDVPYFSVVDVLCPERKPETCRLLRDDVLVTFDTLHMPKSAALDVFRDAPFLR